MADRVNQHFVPKLFFRLFNGGKEFIHLLLRKNGEMRFYAPIKGQCAKPRFYGDTRLEKMFSALEGEYAVALRNLVRIAWDPSAQLDQQIHTQLLNALVFQRNRTEHEIHKLTPMHERFTDLHIEMFRNHLKNSPDPSRQEMVDALDSGKFEIEINPQFVVLQAISLAFRNAPVLRDLRVSLLRNRTPQPFVFSDAPVVFVNTYCRKIKDFGVLGLQSPGLQIFWPLDPRTAIMLADQDIYDGAYLNSLRVDVTVASDISHLNAIQLHHSLQTIFFADKGSSDYVHNLWSQHRDKLGTIRTEVRVAPGFQDGAPIGDILHAFEPQIPHRLDLSFIFCKPLQADRYRTPQHRSPELVQENDEHWAKLENKKSRAKRV